MNYQKIYDSIIEKARLRDEIDGYYEKHHILPKSLGGLDSEENLVKLTYREHFLCHRLLTKIFPNENKMHYAFWTMSVNPRDKLLKISSRCYSEAKENFIKCKLGIPLSDETKMKISIANTGKVRTDEMKQHMSEVKKENPPTHWIGKEHTEESKEKMSISAKTRVTTEANEQLRREGISKAHRGKILSEEHVKHISESKQGEKNPMYGKVGKDNPRSKVVYQYSLNNELINKWDNAQIASEELKISYAGIRNCVTGKTKTSGKFIWKEK